MTGDHLLSKLDILIQQKRFADAERVLRDLLSQDPNNIAFLSMLSETKLQQGQHAEARQVIDDAIGLSPDTPELYHTKARIALLQDRYDEAEALLEHAIELNAWHADFFALLAHVKLARKKYQEALDQADRALEIDAENLLALNTRSTALLKLNKKEESFQTIEGALRGDPNNAYTHANYGWALLEQGKHKKALEHFKQALQSDPSYDYARAGILEALKASNPVYRLFLKYAFFMGNLTAKYQWGVIIGFYLGMRGLQALADNNEGLQPYLTPIIIAFTLFAFSTWIITPFSNLFLRFNKYGQLLLDKKQKMSSNFVAISFLLFLLGLSLYLVLSDERYLTIAAFGFAMMLPLGVMFSPSRNKRLLHIYVIAMAMVGIGAIFLTFQYGQINNLLTTIFLVGFIAYQWIANFLVIRQSNR